MDYSFEPIDINVNIFMILYFLIQKYGIHTYNYLLKQAKRDKLNIKKLNPPGAFKKIRGKRDLGEKYDSKFYPSNYKRDVYYMNYEDLLDSIYMEKKGIDIQLRPSNNNIISNQKKDENKNNNANKNNINYNNLNDQKNEDGIIMKNKSNQFTFKDSFNNNFDENNQKANKNILRGKPKNLNEFQINMNNNENSQSNNYINEDNKNILNRYEDNNNNNIPEEQNEIINNNINQENNEYQTEHSNNNEDNNNININESEDPRLKYVMNKLGLESLIPTFESYHMSFNDVLFLTKDDLNELGLKIFQKNRLLSFIEEYTSKAKNYTLEEIKSFFEENSIYNISNIKE